MLFCVFPIFVKFAQSTFLYNQEKLLMIILIAPIGSPKNFFQHFRSSGREQGEQLCVSLHLIWKILVEIPQAPDVLFFQLLDGFLHLVKNQRDSADSFVWYCRIALKTCSSIIVLTEVSEMLFPEFSDSFILIQQLSTQK